MRARSETFRALWDSHDVYERVTGQKRIAVAGAGVLRPDFEAFTLTGPEGHLPYVYFARPGSPDDEALSTLSREAAPEP